MPTITFFVRSNNDQKQTTVLYCRVTVSGTTSEFSLREKIDPGEWDQGSQTFTSKNRKRQQYVSMLLDSIRYKIKSLAITVGTGYTARQLIEQFKGTKIKVPESIYVADVVLQYIKSLSGTIAHGTMRNHHIKHRNLLAYEKHRQLRLVCNREMPGSVFDLPEAERFKDWFSGAKGTGARTTASRNVELYKAAMFWAVKKGILRSFDLSMYKGDRDPVKAAVHLDHSEMMRLITHHFAVPLLQRVKDLYLFQCATGVSYGDLWGEWQIKDTPKGQILSGVRNKNGQSFFVPVDNAALTILQRYNWKLPKIENGTYNRLLKELAAILGINKRLTTHTGRKTFATAMDSCGWSRESISKMLGHKSIRTTETYYLGDTAARVEWEMGQRSVKHIQK